MNGRDLIAFTRSVDTSPQWFVVRANPRGEDLAASTIRELGIEVYLPAYIRRIRHGRKSELVRRPLFPGYLFARFAWDHPGWPGIFSRRGVRGMILDKDRRPKAVPNHEMDAVRSVASEYDGIECEAVPIEPGMAVMLIEGIFNGFQAKVLRAGASPDVDVEVNIFGRVTKATVPRSCVAVVGA